MEEKKNHSNDPSDTQPITPDGKYTFKDGGGVSIYGDEEDDDGIFDYVDDKLPDFAFGEESTQTDEGTQYDNEYGLPLRKDFDPNNPAKGFEAINSIERKELQKIYNSAYKEMWDIYKVLKANPSGSKEWQEVHDMYDQKAAEYKKYWKTYRKMSTNCQRCSVAFELWCRGLDVRAGVEKNKYEMLSKNFNFVTVFDKDARYHLKASDSSGYGVKTMAGLADHIEQRYANSSQYPVGTRFIVTYQYGPSGHSGHAINAIKEDHEIVFYDAQSGEKFTTYELVSKRKFNPSTFKMLDVNDRKIFKEGKFLWSGYSNKYVPWKIKGDIVK